MTLKEVLKDKWIDISFFNEDPDDFERDADCCGMFFDITDDHFIILDRKDEKIAFDLRHVKDIKYWIPIKD